MEKLTEFIKRHWISIIILIVASIIITYLSLKYMDTDPKDPITSLVSTQVTEFKNNLKEDNYRVATNKSEQISGVSLEEYNRLKAQYGESSRIAFEAFTNVNAMLQDSLKIVKLERDDLNNKKWVWETVKPSGSVIKASMNEKDSILHTEMDIKINVTDVVDKGKIFKKDKFYTDFYSPDQNIKVNGVKTFRKEIVIKPKRLGLGLQFGYGLSQDFKIVPYVGVGLSYNFLNL